MPVLIVTLEVFFFLKMAEDCVLCVTIKILSNLIILVQWKIESTNYASDNSQIFFDVPRRIKSTFRSVGSKNSFNILSINFDFLASLLQGFLINGFVFRDEDLV